MRSKVIFWLRWMRDYSLGEILAIGAATTMARFLLFNFSGVSGSMYSVLTTLILVTAGTVEGIIIGYFQHKSLSKIVNGLNARSWILATTIASVVGWLLILPPSLILIAVLSRMSAINSMETFLYVSLIGSMFGALVSSPQFFLLKRHFRNPLGWIMVNIAGWAVTFLTIYAVISVISQELSVVEVIGAVVISCIISGTAQGLITGTFLRITIQSKL